MMSGKEEEEEDEVGRQKRPRSDVAAEEEDDDVAAAEEEVDDEMVDLIISENEILIDGPPSPRRPRREPCLELDTHGWSRTSHDALFVKRREFDDPLENKSIEPDQDAYGEGVPYNMMSDAELWKYYFGGRRLAPGEDAFKEGIGPLPDTLVNVQKPGEEDSSVGVVREVLPDNSYKVAMGSDGNGDLLIALSNEIKVVPPMESDKVKILGGVRRGDTGNLIHISGNKGLVKFDHPLSDNSYKVAMGSDGNGDLLTALSNEIKVVPPMESDKVKILGGVRRGDTGNLIHISGNRGLVKFDHPLSVCRMNMKVLAKLVHVQHLGASL